ncbi:MAG: hypothetical protein QOJ75_1528, partial [Chloroflexota bacterium]|nr:hypothetical protein [Chloroflexota bacterium]
DLTETLAIELADGALSFARAHRFVLADRPRVDLLANPRMRRADIRVEAWFSEASIDGPGAAHEANAGRPTPDSPAGTIDPTATRVFTLPKATSPRAAVRVTDPDGRTRYLTIGADGLTIGRSDDNDLVARDSRVSRHHGRVAGRRGTLVYLDLGSTNGSTVNGDPVTEVVLGVGDRLEVGGTTIVVEGVGAPD